MSTNQELSQEVMKIIKIAAMNGTLTEEAVKHINKIIDENNDLLHKVTDLCSTIKMVRKERDEAQSKVFNFNQNKTEFLKRKREIREREKKITRLELDAQWQAERVKDHKEMFSLIFRNIETRKNIFTPVDGGTQYDGKKAAGHVQTNEQIEKNT
jgi:predicted RNase H-like nuclease (RuvC/YqgF family)